MPDPHPHPQLKLQASKARASQSEGRGQWSNLISRRKARLGHWLLTLGQAQSRTGPTPFHEAEVRQMIRSCFRQLAARNVVLHRAVPWPVIQAEAPRRSQFPQSEEVSMLGSKAEVRTRPSC